MYITILLITIVADFTQALVLSMHEDEALTWIKLRAFAMNTTQERQNDENQAQLRVLH